MRTVFLGLFKVLLIGLVIGMLSLAAFYLVNTLAWPWWSGAVLLSALAGVTVLMILLYRSLQRRKERAFVERVVAQDECLIQQASASSRQRLRELQQRWLDAVATLRQSRLRYRGNPLYVLPWYLVLGESRAGKSSAIAHSELTAILSPVGPIPGIAATRHCDWWFFEQSVVIDTAGRYTKPINGIEDEREWHEFLTLLAHYRRREPLNGIVVTLPAEQLLHPEKESLYDTARHIGDRINGMIQRLGVRIPVYLMITKADQINGFVAYANSLAPKVRRQAFGYTMPPLLSSSDPMAGVLAKIVERLQLGLLQGECASSRDCLLLAEELNLLKEPLQRFVEAAFSHERYHEPVLLRGLYFTSSCQPGVTLDNAFKAFVTQSYPAQNHQGLFLYDLFARLLPGDRTLYQPIKELLRWRTLTDQLLLVTVLLLSFASITLLGVNYLDGEQQIYQLQKTLNHARAVSGSVEQEILALDALRQIILQFEANRRSWHLLRVVLQQPVDEALEKARNYFVKRFTTQVRQPLEQHFLQKLNRQGSDLPAALVGDAAGHLSWLLEALKARSSKNFATIPRDDTTISRQLIGVDIEYQNELWRLYQAFIWWQQDTQVLHDLASTSRQALNWLLTTHNDWGWIIQWASDPINVAAVKADNFWQFPIKDPSAIPGAYTAQGRRIIGRLLKQLQLNSQRPDFEDRLQRFWNRYALQYRQSWSRFLQSFPKTAAQLKTSERRLIAQSLVTVDNPFFTLQRTAERELSAIADLLPLDLSALQLSNAIITRQQVARQSGAQGVLQRGEQLLADAVAQPGHRSPDYLEKITLGIKLYEQLQQSIQGLLPSLQSEATAAKRVADLLTPSSTDEVAFKGWEAISGLQKLLVVNQQQVEGSALFEDLYRFLLETELALAAHYLQDQWEADVYGALQYIAPDQQSVRLFSEGGLLTKFMQGPLKPFITRQADGWHPTRYQGLSVPLSADFFDFVEQGTRLLQQIKTEYPVTLQACPLKVNRQAVDKPLSATLILQCSTASQQLVNYNYPVSQIFHWRPEHCGAVELAIDFQDLTLRKVWPGSLGFADFLADFRYGTLQLTAAQFPEQKAQLQKKGVEWLKVSYQIAGQQAILNQRASQRLPVPLAISTLHDRRG